MLQPERVGLIAEQQRALVPTCLHDKVGQELAGEIALPRGP
ncbi:hypothetical protein AB0F68_07240 [Micromonospora sp. NPDC023966]